MKTRTLSYRILTVVTLLALLLPLPPAPSLLAQQEPLTVTPPPPTTILPNWARLDTATPVGDLRSPLGELHVCSSGCAYTSVQAAVDAASDGDVIKVASGTYTGVSAREGVIQMAYIDKTITLRGGYTTTNWTTSDPAVNPTTLDAQGQGRVLYITGYTSPTVKGLRITGGDATGLGGGPYDSGAGGGIYISNAGATISDNRMLDNISLRGGGLYLTNGDQSTISGNIIVSNTAIAGGGLYLDRSDATISGNTIVSNTASYGGGAYLYGGWSYLYSSGATLTNNVIADNRADIAGAGLYVNGSSPILSHTTIARNSGGDGSGVFVTGHGTIIFQYVESNVVFRNTILVSHTVGISITRGGSVEDPFSLNSAMLEATLWGTDTWANDTDWGGTGTIFTGTVNIRGNPGFMDPDTGNYHISVSSAAIDRGVNTGVEDDIDGESRPYPGGSEGYDIGADEFHPSPNLAVTKHASLDLVQTGACLTYTIFVTNTGNVTLNATITDFLPAQVVPTGFLTWSTVIAVPGGIWSQSVPATVAADYEGSLTNVVRVTTQEGVGSVYTHTAYVGRRYLPLVLRNF